MRFLGVVLILISGVVYGQSENWEPAPIMLQPIEISEKISLGLSGKYFNNENKPLTYQNFDTWIDRQRFQHFNSNEFMFNRIAGADWGLNPEIIMGSVMTQQFRLGNMRFSQNYIFDASGNLRNSEFSIQFGDN